MENNNEQLLEQEYQQAMDLIRRQDVSGARAAFLALGTYKDSSACAKSCGSMLLQDQVVKFEADPFLSKIYSQGLQTSMSCSERTLKDCARDYDIRNLHALHEEFKKYSDVPGAQAYIDACRNAIEEYGRLNQEVKKDASYKQARDLFAAGQFAKAIPLLEKLGDYGQASELLQAAKVRKAEQDRVQQEQDRKERAIREKKEKKQRTIKAIVGFVLLLAIVLGVGSCVYFQNCAKFDAGNIKLTVLGKDQSSWGNNCEIVFTVKLENNSKLALQSFHGQLVVYNAAGDELDKIDFDYSGELASGREVVQELTIDRSASAEIIELYEAELEDLRITFNVTKAVYEGNKEKTYKANPVTILEPKSNQSSSAEANDDQYDETEGNGLPSEEQMMKVAEKYAVGDYAGARDGMAALGYGPETVEYIAFDYAAQGFYADAVRLGVSIIIFPEGTEVVPDNCLKDSAVEQIVLPSTVKEIGDYAFSGCKSLISVTLQEGLETIGDHAFSGCENLTSVTLPEGLVTIGERAFNNCENLTSVNLPEGLETIGAYAFCLTRLESVTIPGSVKTISERAFWGCGNVRTLTLGEGVEVIEESAFAGIGVKSLTLPDSLVRIGKSAFSDCGSLETITIPKNVQEIGRSAFEYCSELEEMIFAETEGWMRNYLDVSVDDTAKNASSSRYGCYWKREV